MSLEVKTDLSRSLRRLAHGMAAESLRDLTDQQLVERALAGCEGAVFQTIVRRHGAMVYGVCWRVLRHAHDAEDAFQATFLVLARNLRAVRERASLASWLHGVARRVALKAQARAEVRRRHERRAAAPEAAPPEDRAKQESLAALDTELARLPERWRLPIVLCYLQGRTQDEAADQLGVSKSTLRTRLNEARRALAERLTLRGVVGSAALFEVLLSDCAGTAAPASGLFAATVEAAAGILAGKPLATVATAEVASLTEEVLKAMMPSTLKNLAVVLLTTSAIAFGVAVLACDLGAPPQTDDEKPAGAGETRGVAAGPRPDPFRGLAPVTGPVPKESAPPCLLMAQDRSLTFFDTDGKEQPFDPWATPDKLRPTNGRLSPDGRWVAALEFDKATARGSLVIRSRVGKGEPVTIPLHFDRATTAGGLPVWSADSRRVLINETGASAGGGPEFVYRVYDLAAKSLTKVSLPSMCLVTDWSIDGKRFLANVQWDSPVRADCTLRVAWLNADGTGRPEYESLFRETGYNARLSPDGKRILYMAAPMPTMPKEEWTRPGLYVMDLATGKRTAVDEPGDTRGHCWSPDGSRVAYTWQRTVNKPAEATERETLLITCDPDGHNRKTVTRRKTKVSENGTERSGAAFSFCVIDWR